MHAVTKILVVFAVVLSILLSALTVAFSANAERIKNQYQAIESRARAAESQLQAQATTHGQERTRLSGEIDALNQQINEILREKSALQQESARLQAEVKQAQGALQGVEAKVDQLAATSNTQAMLISSYRGELSTLREAELKAKQREIELADQINDLSGQLEVAIETNRALQEQIEEIRQQQTTALASGSARPDASAPIRARVTNVSRGPDGSLLAEIDAGTNDRLRSAMELTIVQDDQFAGVLQLTTVELNESVGRIRLNQGREIRPGAMVTTIR